MANNYFLTQDGKLITISDDELYHWKYIKRERVNGKWQYFYNNEEYQAYQNAKKQEAASMSRAAQALSDARRRANDLSQKSKEAASKATGEPGEYKLSDDRTLNRGKVGDDIAQAQKLLKNLGYDLGTTGKNKDGLDGSFGPKTQNAVMEYQKKKGLKVDGSIGPETMASLKADADKMNKANQVAKDLAKAADMATRKKTAAAKAYTATYKSATKKTAAAKKAYEKTAGAKIADLITSASGTVGKARKWIDGLLSKKKK